MYFLDVNGGDGGVGGGNGAEVYGFQRDLAEHVSRELDLEEEAVFLGGALEGKGEAGVKERAVEEQGCC